MKYIIAIDQGTSSTRALLVDETARRVTMSQYPIATTCPYPGWVEQDPEEIWQTTLAALQEVVSKRNGRDILACGLTNQRETTIIWDKETGQCLAPAIVWQDRRTQAYCDSLADYQALIAEKTGLRLDPYFSATKLRWLLDNIPECKALIKRGRLAFGTIDSFLIWRLTGGRVHRTDVTNASRTLLFNIHTQSWDDELLSIFGIPASVLPEVCSCDDSFGVIDPAHCGYSIPLVGVAGDQQAALIGQCCFQPGMIKATYGTGGFLLMNTGTTAVHSPQQLLTTIAYRIKGQTEYGLEGSIYDAGTTIKWLRDELKVIATSAVTEELAKSLSGNEGVYLVPSFSGLGAPHWVIATGAYFVGLSRQTNRAHFARAALESVCYQTRDVLTSMRHASGLELATIRVDGGMVANQWFLQFLASQCNVLVQRPVEYETTALGAIFLAMLGTGLMSSLDDLQAHWQGGDFFYPSSDLAVVDRDYQGWVRALQRLG